MPIRQALQRVRAGPRQPPLRRPPRQRRLLGAGRPRRPARRSAPRPRRVRPSPRAHRDRPCPRRRARGRAPVGPPAADPDGTRSGADPASSNAFLSWASVLRPHPDATWTARLGRDGVVRPRAPRRLPPPPGRSPRTSPAWRAESRAEIGFLNPNHRRPDDPGPVRRGQPARRPRLPAHVRRGHVRPRYSPRRSATDPPDPETPLGRALRVAYVHHLVATPPDLDGVANSFARAWLSEALVSSLVAVAASDEAGGAGALAECRVTPSGMTPTGPRRFRSPCRR